MRGAEASSDAKSSSVASDAGGDVVREPQEPRKRRASSAPREEAARCSLIPDPNCDGCSAPTCAEDCTQMSERV